MREALNRAPIGTIFFNHRSQLTVHDISSLLKERRNEKLTFDVGDSIEKMRKALEDSGAYRGVDEMHSREENRTVEWKEISWNDR